MRSRQAGSQRADSVSAFAKEQHARFIGELGSAITDARVDAPADPAGEWWIDLQLGDLEINVAWRHDEGFGIFASLDAGYGDRPEEIFRNPVMAARRVSQLAAQWIGEGALRAVTLADLRRLVGRSQTDIATRLDVDQAVISRLENRHDAKLTTLVEYLRALGGELRLVARFEGFEVPVALAVRDDSQSRPLAANNPDRPSTDGFASLLKQTASAPRKIAALVEHWSGTLSDWLPMKPALGAPLASGPTMFVGAEVSLPEILPDDVLKTSLSWTKGRLRIMSSRSESDEFRSIHASVAQTDKSKLGDRAIILELSDRTGDPIVLRLTSERPSVTVRRPPLHANWEDLRLRLLVEGPR